MNVTCPACGFAGGGDAECARCGIVFAKWRARRDAGAGAGEGDKRKDAESPREEASAFASLRLGALALKSSLAGTDAGAGVAAAGDRVLVAFFRQMSGLLQAGLALQDALGIAGGDAAPRVLRRATAHMRGEIARGATFRAALDSACVVDREVAMLLGVAETIGNLPETFAELAVALERRIAFRRAVGMGLAYPAVLVVLSIFALPIKVLVFEGPVRYFAETLPAFGGALGAVVFFAVLLPRVLARFGAPHGIRDAVSTLPIVGEPWRALRVARFARGLGRFIEAGVEIGVAMRSAAASTGQRRFVRAVEGAIERLGGGTTLADALGETGLFAADFSLAVDGAERAGRLPEALFAIARSYEDAALHRIRLTILLGTTIAVVAVMALIGYRLFVEVRGTVRGVEGVLDSVLNEADGVKRGVEKSLEALDKLLDQ